MDLSQNPASDDVEASDTQKEENERTLLLTRGVAIGVLAYSVALISLACIIMYSVSHVQPDPPTLMDVATEDVTRADLLDLLKRSVKGLGTCNPTLDETRKVAEYEVAITWTHEHWEASDIGWNWNFDASGEGDDDVVITLMESNGFVGEMTAIRPAGCVADPGVPGAYSTDFIEAGQFHPALILLHQLDNGCYARLESTGVGPPEVNVAVGSWIINQACEDDTYDWLEDTPMILSYSFTGGPNDDWNPATGSMAWYTFSDGESIEDCLPSPMGFTGLQVL